VSRLFVDLAPMGYPRHVDRSRRVVNDVHNPVVTNPNPPFVVAALEFLGTRRPGNRRQMFETRHNAGNQFRGQPVQLFSALVVNATR
jgi:hypothetical protein